MPAFPNLVNRTWNYSADDNLLSGLDVGSEAHYIPVFPCPYAEKVPGFAEGSHTQGVGQSKYIPDWNRIAPAQQYTHWAAENPDLQLGGEFNGFHPEATFNDPNLVNAIRLQQAYTDAEEFKDRTAPTVKRLTLEQMIEQYMEAILRDKKTMAYIMDQAHMLKGATPFEQREFIRSMVTRQLSMGTTPQYQQTQQMLMDYFGIPSMQEPEAAAGAGLPAVAPAGAPPPPASSVAATEASSAPSMAASSLTGYSPSESSSEPSYTPSVADMVQRAMGRIDLLTSSHSGSLDDSRSSSPTLGRTRLTEASLMAHQMERNRFAIGGEESHEGVGEYMAPTAISDESRFRSGGTFTSFALPSVDDPGLPTYGGHSEVFSRAMNAGPSTFIFSGGGYGAPMPGERPQYGSEGGGSTATIGSQPIDLTKGGRPIYGSESQGSTISRGRGSEPSDPSIDPDLSPEEVKRLRLNREAIQAEARRKNDEYLNQLAFAKKKSASSSGSSSAPVVPGKPVMATAKRAKKKGKK